MSTPTFQRSTLPTLARVVADYKLRKDLRLARNRALRAGDVEHAQAIDALLAAAGEARGGEFIPFTVQITPGLFKALGRMKRWEGHASVPGLAESILADAVRTELRARIKADHDVPQDLVEEFLA